jgi:hypothetical protein
MFGRVSRVLSGGHPSAARSLAAAIVAATDCVATLPASLVEVLGKRFDIRAVVAPVERLIKIKLCLARAYRPRSRDACVPQRHHPRRPTGTRIDTASQTVSWAIA